MDEVSIQADAFDPTSDIVVLAFEGANRAIRPEGVKRAAEIVVFTVVDERGNEKQRHAAISIQEYWVVDIEGKVLHRFASPNQCLEAAPRFAFGIDWPSPTIAGQTIASLDLIPV